MYFTWTFWQDALSRGLRTFAQTLAAALGGSALNVWNAGWVQAIGLAAGSSLLSVLMTIDRSGATLDSKHRTAPAEPLDAPATPVEGHGFGESLR